MSHRITDADREQMFLAWQEKQTVNHVQVKCGFHNATVKKYRTLDKWDARLKNITVKVKRKVDKSLVIAKADIRTEHAQVGRNLRTMGMGKLSSMEPEDIDPRLAKDLVVAGVDMERTAIGDVPVDNVIVLVLPPGMEGIR